MKLEEIPKSTEEVRKFSNGNMLLTLWFTGSHCKSMEVVFDMLSGTSVLFCTNKKATTTILKMKSGMAMNCRMWLRNVKEFLIINWKL